MPATLNVLPCRVGALREMSPQDTPVPIRITPEPSGSAMASRVRASWTDFFGGEQAPVTATMTATARYVPRRSHRELAAPRVILPTVGARRPRLDVASTPAASTICLGEQQTPTRARNAGDRRAHRRRTPDASSGNAAHRRYCPDCRGGRPIRSGTYRTPPVTDPPDRLCLQHRGDPRTDR